MPTRLKRRKPSRSGPCPGSAQIARSCRLRRRGGQDLQSLISTAEYQVFPHPSRWLAKNAAESMNMNGSSRAASRDASTAGEGRHLRCKCEMTADTAAVPNDRCGLNLNGAQAERMCGSLRTNRTFAAGARIPVLLFKAQRWPLVPDMSNPVFRLSGISMVWR